jgi:hypothetical protein
MEEDKTQVLVYPPRNTHNKLYIRFYLTCMRAAACMNVEHNIGKTKIRKEIEEQIK